MDKNVVENTQKNKETSKVFNFCSKLTSLKMVLITGT